MGSLLIYNLLIITFQLSAVSAENFSFIQPATGPSSVCEGSDVTLQCVVVFISADNSVTVQANVWTINGILATTLPNHRGMRNSTTGGITDLVITNVTLEDNNTSYTCSAGDDTITSSVVLNVRGDINPPSDVSNVNILSDTITACSCVVQWSESSNDTGCDTVRYTLTVSTKEEGILNLTNITVTNYNITGLNNNTVYHVNVTASNNVGSSDPTGTSITTNSVGLPSSPPNVTLVSPLSNRSCTINWTISDPSYSYIVILTNLNTGVVDNFAVPEGANSHIVEELSDNTNYNVRVAAMSMCGNKTSDPVTVNTPTQATTANPSATNNVTDTSNQPSESSTNAIVIIIPVVVAVVVLIIIVIIVISLVIYWRKPHKEVSTTIKPNDESKEDNYAQPNGTMNAPQQEKNNEEYAYAHNGPRGLVFPSTTSEKPQQQ